MTVLCPNKPRNQKLCFSVCSITQVIPKQIWVSLLKAMQIVKSPCIVRVF